MGIINSSVSWPVNVIIMAGGKGTRLKSLTENTHKSMIEIADKSVILHLIEHLASFGLRSIYVSTGHLSSQIINSIQDGGKLGISIKYIFEDTPMGSIGSLSLKEDWEHENFLVVNGDIFTNFNVSHFINEFFTKEVDMAILTVQNCIEMPLGVFDIDSNGKIINFTEKPKYYIQINTGVYLFNQRILNLLPAVGPMEGWELIQSALNMGHKLISIPLENGYWIDIGTTETLLKAQEMALAKNTD